MMIFFALVACSAVISVIWLGWIVWNIPEFEEQADCQLTLPRQTP